MDMSQNLERYNKYFSYIVKIFAKFDNNTKQQSTNEVHRQLLMLFEIVPTLWGHKTKRNEHTEHEKWCDMIRSLFLLNFSKAFGSVATSKQRIEQQYAITKMRINETKKVVDLIQRESKNGGSYVTFSLPLIQSFSGNHEEQHFQSLENYI